MNALQWEHFSSVSEIDFTLLCMGANHSGRETLVNETASAEAIFIVQTIEIWLDDELDEYKDSFHSIQGDE